MKAYYHARAPEYDDWYLGRGGFAALERPFWEEELDELQAMLQRLPPVRTLDVACGTGFLTRHLRGEVTGLDQSAAMLEIAATRVPEAELVLADALPLPFADDSFDRIFTAHFYGHLEEHERLLFLEEARRVAPELVVVDAPLRPEHERAERQERLLRDGSRWEVFKRFFDPDELADELGGGETLFAGSWFVAVRSRRMRVVPFMRVADAEASAAWYAQLGFRVEWRHRFAPGLPLFIALSNGGARIFLSEHTGDARPDTLLYLYVDDVDAIANDFELEPHEASYGMREIELRDPDGNRLRLGTPVAT